LVTVEIESSGEVDVSMTVDQTSAEISVADGSVLPPIDWVSRSKQSKDPDVRARQPVFEPLWGSFVMPPSSVIRGQLVFDIPSGVEVQAFRWVSIEGATRPFM
jgi:hypothetical protein